MIRAILPLAEGFRSAIERCPKDRLTISFADFPYGSCGDTTLLLAKHLENHGHAGFAYILGMRAGRSHAWLGRDDLVVDITGDQFDDQDRPVVVDFSSKWHLSFELRPEDQCHPADFCLYDPYTVSVLAAAYAAIAALIPPSI